MAILLLKNTKYSACISRCCPLWGKKKKQILSSATFLLLASNQVLLWGREHALPRNCWWIHVLLLFLFLKFLPVYECLPIDGCPDGEGHNVPRQTEDERDAHRLEEEAPAPEPLPRRGQRGTASAYSDMWRPLAKVLRISENAGYVLLCCTEKEMKACLFC